MKALREDALRRSGNIFCMSLELGSRSNMALFSLSSAD